MINQGTKHGKLGAEIGPGPVMAILHQEGEPMKRRLGGLDTIISIGILSSTSIFSGNGFMYWTGFTRV
jgi:hypothetical protein